MFRPLPPQNSAYENFIRHKMKIFKFFHRNKTFINNVGILLFGSIIARFIAFLAVPIVARLFSPTDFGVAALFVALTSALVPLSTLQYEQAIILPKDEADANIIAQLAFVVLLSFILGLFLLVVFIMLSGLKVTWLDTLGGWTYALPVSIGLIGLSSILGSLNVRAVRFGTQVASEISQTTTMASVRIASGLTAGSSVSGLNIGYLLGIVVRCVILGYKLPIKHLQYMFRNVSQIRKTAKEYRDFPFYSTPTRLLGSISTRLFVIFLAYLYSPAIVGFYAMGYRLLGMPAGIIRKSIGQTYLQKASTINQAGRSLLSSLIKTTIALSLVGLPLCILLIVAGEELLVTLLGEKWRQAGLYAEILAPWLFTMVLTGPANSVYKILQKQALLLKLQIINFAGRLAVLLIAFWATLNPERTLFLFMIVSMLGNLLVLLNALIISRPQKSRSTG